MKKISLLLALSLMTILTHAQNDPDLDGKYLIKFGEWDFEDSLIIKGDSLIYLKNAGWHYGIYHTFFYSINNLGNEVVEFQQIGHLRDGRDDRKSQTKGNLFDVKAQLIKQENGDLKFISPPNTKTFYTMKRINEQH